MRRSAALLLATVLSPALAGSLSGPYTDPTYLLNVPFGAHSHWIQPWRAYLETVPAQRFVEAIGVNLNLDRENPDLVCRMLGENGVRVARIEVGWAQVDWDDETKLNGADRLRERLLACRRWSLRPLILLNAHHGAPGPVRFFERAVTADAAVGDRKVTLDLAGGLVLGRSGLNNLTDYWAAEALVTAVEGNTIALSKPLPKPIAAGTRVPMATLKYRPFSEPGSPDFAETVAAWQRYTLTVARFVTEILGTRQAPDRGFDMEIWNEMSFGSNFTSINNYYRPELLKYRWDTIYGNLVKATCEVADQHPDEFAGVRFDDGFGNTLPWPASSLEPPRVAAIGKHPYAGRKSYPKDEYKGTRLNALGKPDEYAPTYTACFPEYFATALQTETMARETAPIVNEFYGTQRGRTARPGNPCTVWITEVGYGPNEDGVTDVDTALQLKAKAVARYLAFYVNKGVDKLTFYAAAGGDLWLGLVRDSFLDYARRENAWPADSDRYVSPALAVMRRMSAVMRVDLDPRLTATRVLRVEGIRDEHDHFQFPGDGTPEHPPLYDREVLAILPYQANARRFVIAWYVMSRDIKASLPAERFTVTLSGLRPRGAVFRGYDPLADQPVEVAAKALGEDRVELGLPTVDYPCLLTVQEG
ncbi:MAG: hypothetical protein HYU66_01310 [Armatimonadetes bacterium]|nr:hypothetical protein [Armatimonadota bacterium]